MANVIYNNLSAVGITNVMNGNMMLRDKASKQVSTGEKVPSAGAAPSDYQISERMRVQLRALEADLKNVDHGQDLTGVAMGGLAQITEIMKTVEAKCIQAANGTNSEKDREAIAAELEQSFKEIDDIANTTQYNGVFPLSAQSGAYSGRMVMNNRYPFSANGEFRPVANIDGNDVRISDEGAGSSYFNQLHLYVNGTAVEADISTSVNWSPVRQVDDKTWKREYHYTNAAGVDISLTQKTELRSVYSDVGMKLGESYFTSYELVNNGGAPAEIDFVYMVDTDLYPAGTSTSRQEHYRDADGNVIQREKLYTKAAGNMPERFENWSRTAIAAELPICGGVTVERGANGPDALVLTRYGGYDLDRIKNGAVGNNGIVDADLVFQMAWMGKSLDDGPLTFDTGSYGFVTLDKTVPSLWIQSGAVSNDGFQVKLCNATTECLGLGTMPGVMTSKDALESLDVVQKARDNVLKMAGLFGSSSNRCSNSGGLNTVYHENLTVSESAIRDADMAKSYANYTKYNILGQTSQAMLAQANSEPQSILSLLQ